MSESTDQNDGQKFGSPGGSTHRLPPALLTSVAALLAAAMPFTAYINGCYTVEVEREKFMAELRLKYVDRAIDKDRDPADRERLMHFLVETTEESEPLHRWAANELKNASSIRKLRAQIVDSDKKMEEVSAELARLQKDRANDKAAASSRERSLRGNLEKEAQERARLAEALLNAEARAGTDASTPTVIPREPKITSAEFLTGSKGIRELRIHGTGFGGYPGRVIVSPGRRKATLIDFSRPPYQSYIWRDNLVVVPISDDGELRGRFTIGIWLFTGSNKAANFSYESLSILAPSPRPQAGG